MGLSRNKVAVPEGVAGTPPFWSCFLDARRSAVARQRGNCRGYEYFQSFLNIYGAHSRKSANSSSIYFRGSPRRTTDERRSNLVVVRSEDGRSNEGMTGKMKKSSLKILRENNRGKRKKINRSAENLE